MPAPGGPSTCASPTPSTRPPSPRWSSGPSPSTGPEPAEPAAPARSGTPAAVAKRHGPYYVAGEATRSFPTPRSSHAERQQGDCERSGRRSRPGPTLLRRHARPHPGRGESRRAHLHDQGRHQLLPVRDRVRRAGGPHRRPVACRQRHRRGPGPEGEGPEVRALRHARGHLGRRRRHDGLGQRRLVQGQRGQHHVPRRREHGLSGLAPSRAGSPNVGGRCQAGVMTRVSLSRLPGDRVLVVDGASELVLDTADLPAYVRGREVDGPRWVWDDTARWYPPLLAADVRVERCQDLRLTHHLLRRAPALDAQLLVGEESELWDRLGPSTSSDPALFSIDLATEHLRADLEDARQLAAVAASPESARLGLLLAAESAGALVAAEMTHAGGPWRGGVPPPPPARAPGPRPPPGGRPPAPG